MKRFFLAICLILLTGCAAEPEIDALPRYPWPSHAPEATPYISAAQPQSRPEMEGESYGSLEEALASIYEQVNNFFSTGDEFEMFRQLPQDEPFSFVVHLEPNLGLELAPAMTAAEEFTALGASVKVCAAIGRDDSSEWISYTCIVTCPPEKLWEMSSQTKNLYHVERLYESVAKRFDIHVWPESSEAENG